MNTPSTDRIFARGSVDKANLNALPGNVTMADVAQRAGVSLKSVSRVINNELHVSEKLRAKVEAAIAELDYVPDTAARSLAGSRSFTIGVLFDNPSPHYTMKIVNGVYRACRENRHHLRFDHLDSSFGEAALLQQLEDILRNGRADGFVLTPPLCDIAAAVEFLERRGIPISRIAPVLDPGRTPAVFIDDAGAAGQVADLLWTLGHRRFGFVGGPPEHYASTMRRQGFIERLRLHNPDVIVHEANGGFDFGKGIDAGLELLSARRYPTAIFAANDDSAAGVIVACGRLGLKVPQDVSVFGFDDSWIAMSVWPYLATVRQPIEDMGHAAAAMLLDRGVDLSQNPQRQLPFELIKRESIAPPK